MSPRLGQHLPEPFVEVHPDDALRFGVADGSFARVTTDYGQCTLKVVVSERQQRGMLFAPIHWSEANATAARVGALVAPFTDPFSGQPENKATPASITPYEFVLRRLCAVAQAARTARRMPGGRASRSPAAMAICSPTMPISAGWQTWLRVAAGEDLAEYKDFGGGVYRGAAFAADRIETCLFIGPAHDAGDWNVVKDLFAADTLTDDAAPHAAVGQIAATALPAPARSSAPASASAAPRSAMRLQAARVRRPRSARRLKAGTNCGSCIPELKRLIAQTGRRDPRRASWRRRTELSPRHCGAKRSAVRTMRHEAWIPSAPQCGSSE